MCICIVDFDSRGNTRCHAMSSRPFVSVDVYRLVPFGERSRTKTRVLPARNISMQSARETQGPWHRVTSVYVSVRQSSSRSRFPRSRFAESVGTVPKIRSDRRERLTAIRRSPHEYHIFGRNAIPRGTRERIIIACNAVVFINGERLSR